MPITNLIGSLEILASDVRSWSSFSSAGNGAAAVRYLSRYEGNQAMSPSDVPTQLLTWLSDSLENIITGVSPGPIPNAMPAPYTNTATIERNSATLPDKFVGVLDTNVGGLSRGILSYHYKRCKSTLSMITYVIPVAIGNDEPLDEDIQAALRTQRRGVVGVISPGMDFTLPRGTKILSITSMVQPLLKSDLTYAGFAILSRSSDDIYTAYAKVVREGITNLNPTFNFPTHLAEGYVFCLICNIAGIIFEQVPTLSGMVSGMRSV